MERSLKASALALILILNVLGVSASTTTGFPSPEDIEAPDTDTQVLPQFATPGFVVRQWVFPSMVFNCSGNVTRWIFRAQETGLDSGEFPRITTWRDLPFTPQTTDFVRVGASGSAEELTGDGPVYEYVLQEPVSVQEGDILGIELPVDFRDNDNVEQLDFEFLDMGDGNAPDSFRRTFIGVTVDIARLASRLNPFGLTRDQQYVPLIALAAVIGGSSATTVVPTSTIPPWTDGSGLGSGLTQELTLAPVSIMVTPTPTTSPGNRLNMAAIIGPAIAASVLVIVTVVVIVSVVMVIKCSHSKQTAGELYETPNAIGMKENEAYGTSNQAQYVATAANEAYGRVGDIPVAENVAYIPTAVNILPVQNEAYGSVSGSGAAVNTDREMYDYVNN